MEVGIEPRAFGYTKASGLSLIPVNSLIFGKNQKKTYLL